MQCPTSFVPFCWAFYRTVDSRIGQWNDVSQTDPDWLTDQLAAGSDCVSLKEGDQKVGN